MPEYPDVINYVEALRASCLGARLERMELLHPFLLRSVSPAPEEFVGRTVEGVDHIGKRIVLGFEGERWMVFHLMIAGRLFWERGRGAKPLGKFAFSTGKLILTEAGSKRRASLHLVRGTEQLASFDPGGIDPVGGDLETFVERLSRENHTLKRALTDPRLVSGIGNAYSDEILFCARLSPFSRTATLPTESWERLYGCCRETLLEAAERIRKERNGEFPRKVTAFRSDMGVHGRYGEACTRCGTAIQRIRYAENECNYCPRCQTEGKVLKDRSLSLLLKEDWPRRIEELEERREG